MKKKLIEVALPLEAINAASAREKSIRHGHPSTLHLWWARRPLAACRAVLFASLVDDPSSLPEEFPTEEAQEKERKRLFGIIEELVKWENSNNERVLEAARKEILKSTDGNPPPVLDPFCGGGSIPLEAQRLGLEAHGSDLNPVAVLITKALIEIPPKFAGQPPVNPESRKNLAHSRKWKGAQGLAEDVRYYGKWMRDEAEKRIGHLYPKAKLPDGSEATVIAWLWARTVKCPNPACGIRMPLVRSFDLSTKKKRRVWVQPEISVGDGKVNYQIESGTGKRPEGSVTRKGARCISCGAAVGFPYVREQGRAGMMSNQLMVIAAEGRNRIYLPPDPAHEQVASAAVPSWKPEGGLPANPRDFKTPNYGLENQAELFTNRQLTALSTFSGLISEVRKAILADTVAQESKSTGKHDERVEEYADAVATYLAFVVDRGVDRNSTICTWDSSPKMEALRNTFARQAVPMTWDFAEGNPFSESSGNWGKNVDWVAKVIEKAPARGVGAVKQLDATAWSPTDFCPVISTDPPYYDNIGYADLSDFFYVWLRRSLKPVYPELFSTLLVPKSQELVATPYRFEGDREKASQFFENGLQSFFRSMSSLTSRDYPMTVFYAFKQTEQRSDEDRAASTGWETMLTGLLEAGFSVDGTWPIRSEMSNRSIAAGKNALASSIVLSCRRRTPVAQMATRREFLNSLKTEMAESLRTLQHGNIAPVDLQQAAIGPGMAILSRYTKVMESDGTQMKIRTALRLISQAVEEVLAEQESEYDRESAWAIAWFEEQGSSEGQYGTAEVLSTAKNVSVKGMEEAGIVVSGKGKVRLLRRSEMPVDWDPSSDQRFTIWEATQHLIRRLQTEGEDSAADLLRRLGPDNGDRARDLAYRLYTISERKGWTDEALAYNSLVVAWPELTRRAAATREGTTQEQMF